MPQHTIAQPRPDVEQAGAQPEAWTVMQAATALQVTRQTVYKLIADGRLTRYKLGRCTRLNSCEVLALIGGSDAAH